MSKSEELFNRAMKILPGGVNSPVRAFKSVSGTPPFIVSASGCKLTDADGKEYLDYIGSWGPMILGHAHPEVTGALLEMVRKGTSFGTPSPVEVDLAEEIIKRAPSVEKVRFVNSGTEATMHAIRIARAFTGRNKIIKFEGTYHGMHDCVMWSNWPPFEAVGLRNSPVPIPQGSGIPQVISDLVILVP